MCSSESLHGIKMIFTKLLFTELQPECSRKPSNDYLIHDTHFIDELIGVT